ncbi:MAG: beta-N-acetylhexosaminidase, partial [Flavobacteriales bacterium]
MRRSLLFFLASLLAFQTFAQTDANLGIIPVPVSIKKDNGTFQLDKTVVLVSNETANAKTADLLNAFIVTKGGFALREAKTLTVGQKAIVLTSAGADKLPKEGYTITITANQIKVVGTEVGLF